MNELEHLSDDELRAFAEQAEGDLYQVATFDHGSEWHEACFAALYMACMEMNCRGLMPKPMGYLQ